MSKTIFNIILIGLGSLTIGFSCSNHDPSKQESTEENIESYELENEPYVNYDSVWLGEFVAFRDAVYRQDLQAIKGFVDFPMEAGDIWYVAYLDEKDWSDIDDGKAFLSQDFDKNTKEFLIKTSSIIC